MLREARNVREHMSSIFRRGHAAGVWGDGLVDLSLATLWLPAVCWADVSDDEIVFLIPALASRDMPAAGARPLALLRHALSTCVNQAAQGLVEAGFAADEETALRIVARTLAAHGADAPTADRPVDKAWQPYVSLLPALMIVSVLDRMLQHLGGSARTVQPPLSLADVLVGSVHAKFNGAYGQSQFAFAHELLTAGAWLGHVLAGRPALMPVAIAGCLLDVLTRNDAERAAVEQVLLTYYAEAAGGVDRVLAICRRVVKGGRPLLMPGAVRRYDASHHPVWDVPLARNMLHGLQRAI
jgi:hypothetical protein